MYRFYLDKVLLPVTPSKMTIKIKNKNKTIDLLNELEVNILKVAGLSQVEFKALLTEQRYGFGTGTAQTIPFYLSKLEQLKVQKKAFQFIVLRPRSFETNMTVSLEEYEIEENAENGRDVLVNIKLKQYKSYGIKTIQLPAPAKPVTPPVVQRPVPPPVVEKRTYTVVRGDCLWNIAIKYYGSGNQYMKIFNANRDKISNPNLIYSNQVLTIP